MNSEKTIRLFRNAYGNDKEIIQLPAENPTEILCVIHPTHEHPDWSKVIAAIEQSALHVHRITTETYRMIYGVLHLHYGDVIHTLIEGDVFVVQPGVVHYAEGKDAIVEVDSRPGWTSEDHILM